MVAFFDRYYPFIAMFVAADPTRHKRRRCRIWSFCDDNIIIVRRVGGRITAVGLLADIADIGVWEHGERPARADRRSIRNMMIELLELEPEHLLSQ
jgi:hypothetical protein